MKNLKPNSILISILFVFFVTSFFQSPALANTDLVTVRGPGGATCQNYLASNSQLKPLFIVWTQGYITSYNQYVLTKGDIANNIDINSLMNAIHSFCVANPNAAFQNAVIGLLQEFKKNNEPHL